MRHHYVFQHVFYLFHLNQYTPQQLAVMIGHIQPLFHVFISLYRAYTTEFVSAAALFGQVFAIFWWPRWLARAAQQLPEQPQGVPVVSLGHWG